jgi:putative endonuclease
LGREKKRLGGYGERMALEFLRNKGYEILETNLRTPFGEIDAVARAGSFTVFVEIKTRATSFLGPPYLAVTRSKQRHIIKNALFYLKRRGAVYSDWRVDVVSVKLDFDSKIESIELIENAIEEEF